MKICKEGLHSFSGRRCVECKKIKARAYSKSRRLVDPGYGKTKIPMYGLKWQRANPEKCSKNTKKWRETYPERHNRIQLRRAMAKRQRTPEWLSIEQLAEIQWHHDLVRELQWLSNEKLVVDHIVPLRGKAVSGLHVPWNLQILTAAENCRKGNSCVIQS